MENSSQNNKRIAKNTSFLYMRLLVTMVIGFFVSRVTLDALGVSDYGINYVVGGLVGMLSLISGSLTAAITRYITVALGKGDMDRVRLVFGTSINILIVLSLIVILVGEAFGLWYINTHLVLPEGRSFAAHWVFQLSLVSFVTSLISLPYVSVITAHEHFKVVAWVSICSSVSTACMVLLLSCTRDVDKLIFYSTGMFLINFSCIMFNRYYAKRKFEECVYNHKIDRPLFREMLSFSSWNFLGASSNIIRYKGTDLVLNLFFGTAVNGAAGIASSVTTAVSSFAANFNVAASPQITKQYSSGDHTYLWSLVSNCTRFSFFLLMVLAVPVIAVADFVLNLWLVEVPDHALLFLRLGLVNSLILSLSGYLITVQLATGKIAFYQCVVGGTQLMILPISYACLRWGEMPPEGVVVVACVMDAIMFAERLIMLRRITGLSIRMFFNKVLVRISLVLGVTVALTYGVSLAVAATPGGDVVLGICSFLICVGSIYLLGLTGDERTMCLNKLKQYLKKAQS